MTNKTVLIAGGGAAGLVAAICAARRGARVTVIDKMPRPGKKILSTGNGRCNLTNEHMSPDCFRGDDISAVKAVLKTFGSDETLSFFGGLGLFFRSRDGYVYPVTCKASTVLDSLLSEIKRLNVNVVTEEKILTAAKTEGGFNIKTDRAAYESDALIIATGSPAALKPGEGKTGYELARLFGHGISRVVPALTGLETADNDLKAAAKVRCRAKISLTVDGRVTAEDEGELQITSYGISGIPVFQVSRYAAKALGDDVAAVIDFLPFINEKDIRACFTDRLKILGYRDATGFLCGMLHPKIAEVILKKSGINPRMKASALPLEKWLKSARMLKAFPLKVTGVREFSEAQVCAGGVKTDGIDPATMESKLVKNLYFAGEVLDVDGICGGYNLQWAWATGYIAGCAAAT